MKQLEDKDRDIKEGQSKLEELQAILADTKGLV